MDYLGLFVWVGDVIHENLRGIVKRQGIQGKIPGVSRYATSPVGVHSKTDEDGSMQIGPSEGSQPSIFQGSSYGSNRKTNAKVMGV